MNNLFNTTEIATIFLDKDLNIRRFTKEATHLIKMIESDVGRPLSDIVSNLKYRNLMDDIQKVVQRVIYKENEIQTEDGQWYQVKIMPYKTSENVIDGAVITLTDISHRKNIQAKTQKALDYADNIINTIREPLIVLTKDFSIISANRSFYRFFKLNEDETEGKNLFQLGDGAWDNPKLRNLLESILTVNSELKDVTVENDFSNIGHKKMILNARQVFSGEEGPNQILVSMEDITGKK
jgi:two-component system CheB/CheR fusion protein